jgi:glutamate 5-kinase
MGTDTPRGAICSAQRIVVKIGSRVLSHPTDGIDHQRIVAIVAQLAALQQAGKEVIIVSSGAVAAGSARLANPLQASNLSQLQARAAVGQVDLMHRYAEAFASHDLPIGQMLLTRDGIDDRIRYLNARSTLSALLGMGAVPVINENDTVMVEEIQFGDNDQLSALVAIMADAEALIILSDVDGLHERPPAEGESPIVPYVPAIDENILARAGASGSGISRGGMTSKLNAAGRATENGIAVVLASGMLDNVLTRIAAGEAVGTCFAARKHTTPAWKQWLAGRTPAGNIMVDDGARSAIRDNGRSLLPIGVLKAEETINVGDTVRIEGADGVCFALGIANFSGPDLNRIRGQRSEAIETTLGYARAETAIHRDNLILLAGNEHSTDSTEKA